MNIKLEDLVNALERSDELQSCVDIENGRVLSMGDGFAENPAGREQSEEERLAEVFSVEDDWQRYIVLPDIYDELRGFMRDYVRQQQEAADHDARFRRQVQIGIDAATPVI